jgi:DNA-binding beta-propeller fold protein YncE
MEEGGHMTDQTECIDEESSGQRAAARWARQLGGAALETLLLAGSAIVPPSRSVAAESAIGAAIQVGSGPVGIAVNPTTGRVYVANFTIGTVSVIDGSTSAGVGDPIAAGTQIRGFGVNAVTSRVYVASRNTNSVRVIDGATASVISMPLTVVDECGSWPTLVGGGTAAGF